MNNQPTQVIVATEHESVVRFYAGHVGNGGINQTGEFTTTRPISPTDLADMAVGLSATFGWLEVQPVATTRKALPAAPRGIGRPRKDGTPNQSSTPAPTAKYRNDGQLWRHRVACPVAGCNHVARRNNMSSYLRSQRDGHMYPKALANSTARTLPAVDAPPVKKPRGAQGTARATNEVYPAIVNYLTGRGACLTTDIAAAIGEPVPNTRKFLNRAQTRGLVIDVSPANRRETDPRMWAVPQPTVDPVQLSVVPMPPPIDSAQGPV